MTCQESRNTPSPSIGVITIGLLLWFVVASLVVGFVTTHANPVQIRLLLDGITGTAESTVGSASTD